MRRLMTGALPCLVGAVAAHAMTGLLVHAGPFGEPPGVHQVHGPLALVAGLVVVLGAIRRLTVGRAVVRPVDVVVRGVVVIAYLVGEAYVAQGLGSHLLHDPWVLLAPAGVLLAHLLANGLAAGVVRRLPMPVMTVVREDEALAGRRSTVLGRVVVSSCWAAAVRGRAPPQLLQA